MPLEVATPPLIIRSVIDDESTLKRFTKSCIDVATAVKGARFVTVNDERLQLAAAALFYGAFAIGGAVGGDGGNTRTLGEEHVGLMPVTYSQRVRDYFYHYATNGGLIKASANAKGELLPITVPAAVGASPLSLTRRLFLALLCIFEGFLMRRLVARLFPHHDRQTVVGRIGSLHTMLFYLFGAFATIPHRIAGVRFLALTPSHQSQFKPKEGSAAALLASSTSTAAPLVPANPYLKLGLMLAAEHLYLLVQALRGWKRREVRRLDEAEKIREKEKARRAKQRERRRMERLGRGAAAAAADTTDSDASDKDDDEDDENADPTKPTTGTCMLCLCRRRNPTATDCGHVFCWSCVTEWLKVSKVCPLCKCQCVPSQLVPLVGYGVVGGAQ